MGDQTQLLILAKHIERLMTPSDSGVVMDRSIMDGFVYTLYLASIGQVSENVLKASANILDAMIGSYDQIFYLPSELELESDGQRSDDVEFRDTIVDLFDQLIEQIDKTHPQKVIRISGTVEQRAQVIIKYIEDTKNGQ